MTIYEVNKIMSSENKSKIIAHFWDCECRDHDVTSMCKKLDVQQANMSKHICTLSCLGILNFTQNGKVKFYYINKKWKDEWKDIIVPQLKIESNNKYTCKCSNK